MFGKPKEVAPNSESERMVVVGCRINFSLSTPKLMMWQDDALEINSTTSCIYKGSKTSSGRKVRMLIPSGINCLLLLKP